MTRPIVLHVINKRPGDIFIGRPSRWGNPYRIMPSQTREDCVAKYRALILTQPNLLALLPTLAGKRLICFCAPLPCHGDVLADLVEALPEVKC